MRIRMVVVFVIVLIMLAWYMIQLMECRLKYWMFVLDYCSKICREYSIIVNSSRCGREVV